MLNLLLTVANIFPLINYNELQVFVYSKQDLFLIVFREIFFILNIQSSLLAWHNAFLCGTYRHSLPNLFTYIAQPHSQLVPNLFPPVRLIRLSADWINPALSRRCCIDTAGYCRPTRDRHNYYLLVLLILILLLLLLLQQLLLLLL